MFFRHTDTRHIKSSGHSTAPFHFTDYSPVSIRFYLPLSYHDSLAGRNYERYIKQQDSVIAKLTVEKDAAIAKLTAEKDATIAELTAERDAAIAALQSQIQSLTDQLQNSPANREPAEK